MSEEPEFVVSGPGGEGQTPASKATGPASQEGIGQSTAAPYSRNDFSAGSVEQAGLHLARDIEAGGYHPVVLFGSAASGKTSLLLSLFAALKVEPDLRTGLAVGDPIMDMSSEYGRYVHENAVQFLAQKTQDFIEGRAAPKTALLYPFFIPVILRPEGKPEQKIAFMESNGEWYRPDRNTSELFPRLKRQIEDFISNYQGGITFIHLLPYTQQGVRSPTVDKLLDSSEMLDASLAVVGALQSYDRIRVEKQYDSHLLLVTKWDAHSPPGATKLDVLGGRAGESEVFVREKYPQALTALQGLGLQASQINLNNYCAGLMNESGILTLKQDNELRPAVMGFPINLWGWLYRRALESSGQIPTSLFPLPPKEFALITYVRRLLNRLF
jgi:hypothetical protein